MLDRKNPVTPESSNGQEFSDAERKSHLRINRNFYSSLETEKRKKGLRGRTEARQTGMCGAGDCHPGWLRGPAGRAQPSGRDSCTALPAAPTKFSCCVWG